MELNGFPFKAPILPGWKDIYKYLNLFAKNFEIDKITFLNHNVDKIIFHEIDKSWTVRVHETGEAGKEKEYEFDFVVVCTGLFSRPRLVKIEGLESFNGVQLHTADYKEPLQCMKKKDVLVIGMGESGLQISSEINSVANSTILSSSRIKRTDFDTNKYVPTMKPRIDHISGSDVFFVDNTHTHVDVIVHATGYHLDLPFLKFSEMGINYSEFPFSRISLYKHIFPPVSKFGRHVTKFSENLSSTTPGTEILELENKISSSLAFVGFVSVNGDVGSLHRIIETQAEYVTAIFTGKLFLPPEHVMQAEVMNWETEVQKMEEVVVRGVLDEIATITFGNDDGCVFGAVSRCDDNALSKVGVVPAGVVPTGIVPASVDDGDASRIDVNGKHRISRWEMERKSQNKISGVEKF
eukprot:TRINITY_DN8359_c0_g1_i36.p1 TRINITY_DN8359_c0_g1~~TRINITY_DN8359_c0_g1_i36.p1  ORF type:complete len:409 (-),score=102.64 TRINITY_DN8359_c0_g1_i36:220-1446(-)